jgi:hypothetical protein
MIKPIVIMIGLAATAGCTTMNDREAPSKCFNTDGSINPACKFKLLTGQPAVFALLETSVEITVSARG